jgi:3-isopropylmalate/(R)-2-methylmalate dehydratase large subunit
MTAQTLFEKIWNRHAVLVEEGETLLYVDRALVHEGTYHAFVELERRQCTVYRPDQVLGFADHYAQTSGREKGVGGVAVPEIRKMLVRIEDDARRHNIRLYGIDDPQQGILHVVPPELGITQPGMMIVGADSHSPTHGGLGCLALGVGASEMMHVMATQTLWQRRLPLMRIAIDGALGPWVSAKDVILSVIAKIGTGGATGYAIEYAGSTIRAMTIEQRMTVCNMSIEAGARWGTIAPDETTFDYLAGRPYAPKGADWDAAVAFWKTLPSDPEARFDREVALDATLCAPMVTWGTSPEQVAAIGGVVPDPRNAKDEKESAQISGAIDYMGLTPGMPLAGIKIDRVFIGSCTNSRIEDLRIAAAVAKGGRTKVPAWIVPGSRSVQRQAEKEGLDRIFIDAGFEWRDPGCSLCTGINGDQLQSGERCASTSNRNFRGRGGSGGRMHLMSPAMAAAAALTGRLTDVRELHKG